MSNPPVAPQGPTWASGSVIVSTPYVVKRALGQGGMGTVYEVEHESTKHIFAFKVLSTRVAEHPELVERVVREAEFLRLLHGAPHVVTVVEWGRLRDRCRRPYLVMERLYGETLHTLLSRRALPLTDALSYVRQVLWGLAVVHGAGVVHRDVKPGTIFVQRDGTCTLLDFGVMKALYDIGLSPSQFSTAKGATVGTPSYMAPEMASRGAVDQRADLFAAGLVLAECLLGFRLLPHLNEHEYLAHLINEGVPSIELSGGEHLPIEVRRLVRRATMFDPARRFRNAQEFIGQINRVAEGLGLTLRPIPPSVHRPPGAGARLSTTAGGATPTLSAGALAHPASSLWPASPPGAVLVRVERGHDAATGLGPLSTLSAQPTRVDSVSPTRVKTPAPASEAERTPPLASYERLRFDGLPSGPGRRAPRAASPRRGARDDRPTPALPPPPPSAINRLLPKLETVLALMKGMVITPVSDVRERSRPTPPATAPAAEQPDVAQRPVSTPTGLRPGEPTNSPAGRRARAAKVALVLGLALVFMFTLQRQLSSPAAVSLPSAARDGAPDGHAETPPLTQTSAALGPSVSVVAPSGAPSLAQPSVSPRASEASPASSTSPEASAVGASDAAAAPGKVPGGAPSGNPSNRESSAPPVARTKRNAATPPDDPFGLPRRFDLRPPASTSRTGR